MKKLLMVALVVLFGVLIGIGIGRSATLDLKVLWTPNTEPDMKEYNFYRVDAGRELIATYPHPPVLPYNFSVTVPDGSAGVLRFVLTAVDTNGNQSADSDEATYSYNLDTTPPLKPRGVSVQK